MRGGATWVIVALLAIAPMAPAHSQPDDSAEALADARRISAESARRYQDGALDDAIRLGRQALEALEHALGPEHPEVGSAAWNLAVFLGAAGDLEAAEPLFERAIRIQEAHRGSGDPSVAVMLEGFAAEFHKRGDYTRAEPLYERALAIREQSQAESFGPFLHTLTLLGWIYDLQGDYARAGPMLERALALAEEFLGPDSLELTGNLNLLAMHYVNAFEAERGKPLVERALAIREAVLGPDHLEVADELSTLGGIELMLEDTDGAQKLLERALTIYEASSTAPDAALLANLGSLYQEQGKLDLAQPLLERAVARREETLGPNHPDLAGDLGNLAWLHVDRGDAAAAVSAMTRANEIIELALGAVAASDAEEQKRAFLKSITPDTNFTISLQVVLAPELAAAGRLALTTVLRRKGRLLDATADTVRVLRNSANVATRAKLDDLTRARTELATLTFRGPAAGQSVDDHEVALAGLRHIAHQLESEVGRTYASLRIAREPTTIEAVQAELGDGTALVELAVFSSMLDGPSFGAIGYVAYVLTADGEPRSVLLGATYEIDELVTRMRAALADPTAPGLAEAARALDEQVMRPIRELLDGARQIYLAPDGLLGLVPFGALIDEHGDYLVDRFQFTYLTSGRDLIGIRNLTDSRGQALVIADPDYQHLTATDLPTTGRRSGDFGLEFERLPGTSKEADALRALLADARVLRGGDATETALEDAIGPRIVHLATHGFFLEDLPRMSDADAQRGIKVRQRAHQPLSENPLLRAGLAFAGANARAHGDDDGILTALEAANLDLHGTKLVVLSACDTGVGEVVNGDGVYGLRRAFVVAGAETVVMSLWQVDDTATKDLMVGYYERLVAGQGRVEAMRQVQLAMMRNPETAHPYYWASFVVSGNPDTLDGTPAPLPTFGRGRRGCGCRAADGTGSAAALALVILLAIRLVPRRRSRVPAEQVAGQRRRHGARIHTRRV